MFFSREGACNTAQYLVRVQSVFVEERINEVYDQTRRGGGDRGHGKWERRPGAPGTARASQQERDPSGAPQPTGKHGLLLLSARAHSPKGHRSERPPCRSTADKEPRTKRAGVHGRRRPAFTTTTLSHACGHGTCVCRGKTQTRIKLGRRTEPGWRPPPSRCSCRGADGRRPGQSPGDLEDRSESRGQ